MSNVETGDWEMLFEGQNKELKAELVQLETAQRAKPNASIATENMRKSLDEQLGAASLKVCIISVAAVDGLNGAAIKRKHLDNNIMEEVLQE